MAALCGRTLRTCLRPALGGDTALSLLPNAIALHSRNFCKQTTQHLQTVVKVARSSRRLRGRRRRWGEEFGAFCA